MLLVIPSFFFLFLFLFCKKEQRKRKKKEAKKKEKEKEKTLIMGSVNFLVSFLFINNKIFPIHKTKNLPKFWQVYFYEYKLKISPILLYLFIVSIALPVYAEAVFS